MFLQRIFSYALEMNTSNFLIFTRFHPIQRSLSLNAHYNNRQLKGLVEALCNGQYPSPEQPQDHIFLDARVPHTL